MLTAAAIQGMKNALAALGQSIEEGIVVDRPDLLVSFGEINQLMGAEKIKALEQAFVGKR